MRPAATVALGLGAGVAGALVVSVLRPSDPPAAAPAAKVAVPPAVVVPPGWDRRYLHRTDELDGRVAALEARLGSSAPAQGSAGAPAGDREQARVDHYQQELATRATRLADHAQEPYDAAWASDGAARLRAAAAELAVTPREIDCRSKTCVASLEFASPGEALEFLHSAKMSKLTRGFTAMTATPTPPTSDGDYELSVVLDR